VAKKIEKFVQNNPLGIFNSKTNEGFWKAVEIFHTTNDLRMIFNVHVYPGGKRSAAQNLLKFVEREFSKYSKNVHVFFENKMIYRNGNLGSQKVGTLLVGSDVMVDYFNNMKFFIGYQSQFPKNKIAAQIMLNEMEQFLQLNEEVFLIEFRFGYFYSLNLAKHVKRVLCVDNFPDLHAQRKSIEENKITNVDFVEYKDEGNLIGLLKELKMEKKIVVIVDQKSATNSFFQELNLQQNVSKVFLTKLISIFDHRLPNEYNGLLSLSNPFRLSKTFAVDTYPTTARVNICFCFER